MGLQHIEPPSVDLVALIGQDVPLRKISRSEFAGPCVLCGGHDRLHVNAAQNWWWCRQCSPRRGDGPGYLMFRDQVGYVEACKRLGGMPAMPTRMVDEPKPITEQQRRTWGDIIEECHRELFCGAFGEGALHWLWGRGLDNVALNHWNIGYNPGRWDSTAPVAGMRVPCGITIPLQGVDGLLYGLSVRRDVPEAALARDVPKYQCLYGSRVPLFGKPPIHTTCLLVEGYFDAILLDRIAGDLVDVAALGSAKGSIDSQWYPYLLSHATWLIAMDNDVAGQKAEQGWQQMSERARILHTPGGSKDPSQWWQQVATDAGEGAADVALRGWIREWVE